MSNSKVINFQKALNIFLLLVVAMAIYKIVYAVTPNPGHDYSAIGGGIVQGDILYGSAADTLGALAKNTSSTRYLSNTGTSNGPAWAQVALTTGVSGILPGANGGTNNGFFDVTGPATSLKTFTFPNASATVLTSNAAVTVAQGGTGVATLGDAGVLVGNGTGAVQVTGAGTSGQVLTSNGPGVDPSFQSAAGGNDGRIIMKTLASAFNSSATTPAKVTGLDTTTTTGTYVFQYYIRWRTSLAGTGVKFDVNHSGTVTSFVWNQRWVDISATASSAAPDQDAILGTGSVMGSFGSRAKGTAGRGVLLSADTVNLDMLTIIEGIMVVTVAGDLQLYFGSEATGSTQSVMENSALILTKIQ